MVSIHENFGFYNNKPEFMMIKNILKRLTERKRRVNEEF